MDQGESYQKPQSDGHRLRIVKELDHHNYCTDPKAKERVELLIREEMTKMASELISKILKIKMEKHTGDISPRRYYTDLYIFTPEELRLFVDNARKYRN